MAEPASLPTPWETPENAKAQRVLEAAHQVFMADGYGAANMDAIAKAACVSKATVYAHFASKDRLFSAIVAEHCRRNFPWGMDAAIESLEPREALRAIGGRFAEHILSPEVLALYRIVVAEAPRFPELGRALYDSGPRPGCTRMAAYLKRLVERGFLEIANPELAARQFFGMIRGDLYLRRLFGIADTEIGITADDTVDAAVEMFWRAYQKSGKTAPAPCHT